MESGEPIVEVELWLIGLRLLRLRRLFPHEIENISLPLDNVSRE